MDRLNPVSTPSGAEDAAHPSIQETIKLRGHHLLCILTYIGKGYTDAFVANFDAIVERLNQGAPVEIITGIDDICAPLRQGAQALCAHAYVCAGKPIKNRDNLALAAIARILQMPCLKAGDKIKLGKGEVRYLRRFFADGKIRYACDACDWHRTCSTIAQSGYEGVRLLVKAVP